MKKKILLACMMVGMLALSACGDDSDDKKKDDNKHYYADNNTRAGKYDKDGNYINDYPKIMDDGVDALRYALERAMPYGINK